MKSKESQLKMLLRWLQSGRSITPLKALHQMGIYRLAARIKELRYKGHSIKAEMVYEHPVKFARYKIVKP